MLYSIFYWVVNISIAATLSGLIITVIRKVKYFPKRLPYTLWGIIFLRFVTPFMYSSNFSIMNLLAKLGTKTIVIEDITNKSILFSEYLNKQILTTNCIQFADSYFPIVYNHVSYKEQEINTLSNVFETSAVIWAIIAVAALLTMAVLYFFTSQELRKAIHYKDNIFISNSVETPTVFGIFKQKIIIPYELDQNTLKYVISHENVHIKQKDNLRRMLALIAACLHWFNPFIWLFLKAYFADMELACDSKVIEKLDSESRKKYAHTLLAFVPTKRTIISSTFSGSKIKLRIENVLAYKTLSAVSAITFSAFTIIIALTILTNAR